ncbi:Serine/threonine-protein kinase Sgk2 [Coemansia sp. BCRC 34301]|nr:Serine/threonine-protein kinase Sgk2 [Coemansia sp. BCRC 34301]
MDSSGNIPSALRHFLARGASAQQQQQSSGHYNTYTPQSAASSMATLQQAPQAKLATAKSSSNLRSGSTIGAWLTKYHLRPGSNSNGAEKQEEAPAQTNTQALTAYITSVESREGSTGSATGGGLRMGRKRFLEYRILVHGSQQQWWVGRRYSEFHALYQALRRQFPGRAAHWASLFPSKRLLGLGTESADSVMLRRERLNAFLRALTRDSEACGSPLVQAFLRDVDSVPGSNPRRSVSASGGPDHLALARAPLPEAWAGGHEQLERMASMPALKSAGARLNALDVTAPPMPVPPYGFNTTRVPKQALVMARKTSDPLAYAATEKRPNAEPASMRKKYGLRRNVLHRNDRLPPDTAATRVAQWDDDSTDYVLVDADRMDTDRTLRADSTDSVADDDRRPTDPGRAVVVLRRAPLGGIEKSRRVLPADDPALVAAKAHLRARGKRAQVEEEEEEEEDDGGRSAAPHKIGLDDFQLLSIIGKGSYGKVMLARYKDTGKVMAIKVISKSKLRGRPNEIRRVMSERKVLERTIEHPFLVGLQCAFQTKEKLFFCLDYVNGGELFFHLQRERRFGENRARFYAAEITSALAYLHGMDVVYRDLKPENCLLDAHGHVRIVDFGLAKDVGPVVWRTEGSALYSVEEGGKTGTFCGTPEYLAPEVLLRQRYGKEVDWYCLGAVLYEMLTGLPPFYHQDNNTMYQRILSEDLRFPSALPPPAACNGTMYAGSGNIAGNAVGRYAQDFVFRMMARDPQTRLGHGVFGTENVKRHVFFHGIDWAKIYRQEYAPPFVPKVSSIFDLSNIDPEFRNEPIPQSILMEGQVDIIAEAAEAERQAELALQARLVAFPSPVTSPNANRAFATIDRASRAQATTLINNESIMAALAGKRTADMDSTIDAFRGFSFVSPWVDSPDNNDNDN